MENKQLMEGSMARLCRLVLIALIFSFTATIASTSGAHAEQLATIPVGTVITLQNWEQYKAFMPEGMQRLFVGNAVWKFPPDFRLVIGPTHSYPLPKEYWDDTKKYSHLVKIVDLPDGGHSITGYVAGQPFPNPQEPLKGYKYLVDTWYTWFPYLVCGSHVWAYLLDRYGSMTSEQTEFCYRQLSYLSAVGQPITNPEAQGVYYSEFTRVLLPEQSRYTTQLTLYYADPTKSEDLFLFIPALRRTLRLSSAARCSPFVGTDFSQDDIKGGSFNGGLTRFQAQYVGLRKILSFTTGEPANFGNIDNYYRTGFMFPTPKVGEWEVRDAHLLDVRRIPSQQSGYCFSKRMLYVDAQSFISTWADLYDNSGKLWKTESFQDPAFLIPHEGMQLYSGDFMVHMWDFQNMHLTLFTSADKDGNHQFGGDACRNYHGVNYDNIKLYSSVAGLSEILR
jgi:hypothetical protein